MSRHLPKQDRDLIAWRLKSRLQLIKMKQYELAYEAGLTESAVSQILSGGYGITIPNLIAIVKVVRSRCDWFTIDYLLKDIGE